MNKDIYHAVNVEVVALNSSRMHKIECDAQHLRESFLRLSVDVSAFWFCLFESTHMQNL